MGIRHECHGFRPTPEGGITIITKEDTDRFKTLLRKHRPTDRRWTRIFTEYRVEAKLHFVVLGGRVAISNESGLTGSLVAFAAKLAVRFSDVPAVPSEFMQVYFKHRLQVDVDPAVVDQAIRQASKNGSGYGLQDLESLCAESVRKCSVPRSKLDRAAS